MDNGKTNLKVTDFEKDVGAHFPSNMHFDEHINITIKKQINFVGKLKYLLVTLIKTCS